MTPGTIMKNIGVLLVAFLVLGCSSALPEEYHGTWSMPVDQDDLSAVLESDKRSLTVTESEIAYLDGETVIFRGQVLAHELNVDTLIIEIDDGSGGRRRLSLALHEMGIALGTLLGGEHHVVNFTNRD